MRNIILSCLALIMLAGCSPIGLALGTGATLGIASAREGGISGTAKDLKIKALISDKWFKYDLGTFTKLNMTINEGRVLITGVVQNPDDRVEAVRLAWQVEGVNQVINEIRVAEGEGLPGYVRDQWITTRLRTVLTFDRDVHSINYSIDTVAGTVYLMGVARHQMELNKVIETARATTHVKQVISYVRMKDERTVIERTEEIESLQPDYTAPDYTVNETPSYMPEPLYPAGPEQRTQPYKPAPVESETLLWEER